MYMASPRGPRESHGVIPERGEFIEGRGIQLFQSVLNIKTELVVSSPIIPPNKPSVKLSGKIVTEREVCTHFN